MLLFALFGSIGSVSNIDILDNGGVIATFIYLCWAIGQFFDGNKLLNYLKALACYLLGIITFLCAVIACGALFAG